MHKLYIMNEPPLIKYNNGTKFRYSVTLIKDAKEKILVSAMKWDKRIHKHKILELRLPSIEVIQDSGFSEKEGSFLMAKAKSIAALLFEWNKEDSRLKVIK